MEDCGNLKQRIHAGEAFRVESAELDDSRETLNTRLKGESCDLFMVDFQHTANDEAALVRFCRSAEELDVPAMLRIPHPRLAYMIGHYLDLGVKGVLIPMVEDPSTVVDAIEAFYYPPIGKRSWWPRNAHGDPEGMGREAYAEWWAKSGVLALQLETVRGVLNVGELAMRGVDLFMFGATDFAFSLAASPDAPFASLDEAQRYAVSAAGESGIRVAIGRTPMGVF